MKSNIFRLGLCLTAVLALVACTKKDGPSYSPSTDDLIIKVGETAKVKVESYNAKSATGTDVSGVTWSVENAFYATVDNEGNVTGRKVGLTSVIGQLSNGGTVMVEVLVTSDHNEIDEPLYTATDLKEAQTYEVGNRLVRSGDDYAVFRVTSAEELAYNPYKIYLFGDKGAISTIVADKFDALKGGFLPDRYDGGTEVYTAPDVTLNANQSPYGPAFFYNVTPTEALLSGYKANAKADIEYAADVNNYTPEKLGTKLPFDFSGVDQNKVNALKNTAYGVIDNANEKSFGTLEAATDVALTGIEALYMNEARRWALEVWCWTIHNKPVIGGLSQGHDQSKYPVTSWDRVLELDELAMAQFAADETYAALDRDAVTYGNRYSDVAAKSDVSKFVSDVNNAFVGLETSNRSKYTDDCWATAVSIKDDAIDRIENKMYSYLGMTSLRDSSKVADMSAPKSLYHDVTTKAMTSELIARLDEIKANYKEADYTIANWKKITAKYDEAKTSIEGTCSYTAGNAICDDAKAYFDSIDKKTK